MCDVHHWAAMHQPDMMPDMMGACLQLRAAPSLTPVKEHARALQHQLDSQPLPVYLRAVQCKVQAAGSWQQREGSPTAAASSALS